MSSLRQKIKAKSVRRQPLHKFAIGAMKRYGKYVIENRALADYRDGLKPVQRRILWAMLVAKFVADGPCVKSARVTGEVMGKYHPHGSSYGVIVNMVNAPVSLIFKQGNFGFFNEKPASERYCFAGSTRIVTDKGFVKIKDIPGLCGKLADKKISIDLKVSSTDKIRPASHWLDSGKRLVYKVSTKVTSVQATSNEPLMVLNEDMDLVWKKANCLETGDLLCYHAEPHDIWSKGNQKFRHMEATLRERQIEFPKQNSVDFMSWLGWVIAEGSMRANTINFANSDPEVIESYIALCKKVFGNIEPAVHWIEPGKYKGKFVATKPYAQVNLNSQNLGKWLTLNGIPLVKSGNKFIPEIVWRASKEETLAFLRALFEGDGSNSPKYRSISYCSYGKQLLKDLQLLLMTKFGLPFCRGKNTIALSGKDFYMKFMDKVGFVSDKKNTTHELPKISLTNTMMNMPLIKKYIKTWAKSGSNREFVDEHGEMYSKYTPLGSAMTNIPLNYSDLKTWWSDDVRNEAKAHLPTLYAKIENVLKAGYMYFPVTEIKVRRKK